MKRWLIAGVGNIFFGDDGFGVEVARRLASEALPDWVRVVDIGIRGIHLVYELIENGCEQAILIDAVSRGGAPGTVYVIELDLHDPARRGESIPDAHGMNPDAVLALLRSIDAPLPRMWLVGCEPARLEETMALSEPVRLAVDEAVKLIAGFLQTGRIGGVGMNR